MENNENEFIPEVNEEVSAESHEIREEHEAMRIEEPVRVKSRAPIFIMAISIMVCLLVGVAFAFSLGGAKNAYFNLESKNMKAMVKSIEDMGKSDFSKLLIYNPDKTVRYDINAKAGADEGTISAGAFEMNLTQNIGKNQTYADVEGTIDLFGTKLNILSIIEDYVVTLQMPELFDKGVKFDATKLDEVLVKLGVPEDEVPNEILKREDLLKAIELTKPEEKKIKKAFKEYGDIIKKVVPNENFKKVSKQELAYDGKTLKCDAIELSIYEENINEITLNILKYAKDDEAIEILIDKYYNLIDLYNKAGYQEFKELPTREEVKANLETAIADAITDLEKTKEDVVTDEEENKDRIILKTYYKGNEVYARELLAESIYDGEIETQKIMSLVTINNKNEKYYELGSFTTFSIDKFIDKVTLEGKKETHELSIVSEYDYTAFGMDKGSETTDLLSFVIDKSNKNEIKVTLEPVEIEKIKLNAELILKKDSKDKATVILDFAMTQDTMKAYFNMTYSAEEGIKIEKKEVSGEVVDSNAASKEEIEKLGEEIGNNAMKLMQDNKYLSDLLMIPMLTPDIESELNSLQN